MKKKLKINGIDYFEFQQNIVDSIISYNPKIKIKPKGDKKWLKRNLK